MTQKINLKILSFSDIDNSPVKKMWGDYWIKKMIEDNINNDEKDDLHITINDSTSVDVIFHMFGTDTNLSDYSSAYKILWIHSHPAQIVPKILKKYNKIFSLSEKFIPKITKMGFKSDLLYGITDKNKKEIPREVNNDLIFVGNAKPYMRGRKIINDLRDSYRGQYPSNLKVWGVGWGKYLDRRYLIGNYYKNNHLEELYRNSIVCLNDHHDDMRKWGFINPRVLDVIASGGWCMSDNVDLADKDLASCFSRYTNLDDLKSTLEIFCKNRNIRDGFIRQNYRSHIINKYHIKQFIKTIRDCIRKEY